MIIHAHHCHVQRDRDQYAVEAADQVSAETYDDCVASKRSDHVPIVVGLRHSDPRL